MRANRQRRVIALLCLPSLVACSEANRTQVFDAVDSPHHEYTLTALIIEPWFPQGPHAVALELKTAATGVVERLIKADLAYDGVPFTKNNIGVRWTGDREALACLRATDRPDQAVQIAIEADGAARVQTRTGC